MTSAVTLTTFRQCTIEYVRIEYYFSFLKILAIFYECTLEYVRIEYYFSFLYNMHIFVDYKSVHISANTSLKTILNSE